MLSRESSRRLEVFCERRCLWTDDDYLGPLHVQTERRDAEVVERPLPEWAGRLTVPEVYAKALAHYADADQGVPRRARAPIGGTGPVGHRGYPGAARRSPRTGSSTGPTARRPPAAAPESAIR